MPAQFLFLAGLNGFLVVAIGAFGAHALQARLLANGTADTFQTGVHYHMFHTLALLAVALLAMHTPDSRLLNSAGYLLLGGIVLFSGSLYTLSLTGISWLGAITPLGGLGFLAAWSCLMVYAFTSMGS